MKSPLFEISSTNMSIECESSTSMLKLFRTFFKFWRSTFTLQERAMVAFCVYQLESLIIVKNNIAISIALKWKLSVGLNNNVFGQNESCL